MISCSPRFGNLARLPLQLKTAFRATSDTISFVFGEMDAICWLYSALIINYNPAYRHL